MCRHLPSFRPHLASDSAITEIKENQETGKTESPLTTGNPFS